MSAINISEKRRPQGEGLLSQWVRVIWIFVYLPYLLYMEKVSVYAYLMRSLNLFPCVNLVCILKMKNKIVSILEKPHGIVLVTGPTGSGKSTSLTAFIEKIHKPERRIMTVEDPVEYEVSGLIRHR